MRSNGVLVSIMFIRCYGTIPMKHWYRTQDPRHNYYLLLCVSVNRLLHQFDILPRFWTYQHIHFTDCIARMSHSGKPYCYFTTVGAKTRNREYLGIGFSIIYYLLFYSGAKAADHNWWSQLAREIPERCWDQHTWANSRIGKTADKFQVLPNMR